MNALHLMNAPKTSHHPRPLLVMIPPLEYVAKTYIFYRVRGGTVNMKPSRLPILVQRGYNS